MKLPRQLSVELGELRWFHAAQTCYEDVMGRVQEFEHVEDLVFEAAICGIIEGSLHVLFVKPRLCQVVRLPIDLVLKAGQGSLVHRLRSVRSIAVGAVLKIATRFALKLLFHLELGLSKELLLVASALFAVTFFVSTHLSLVFIAFVLATVGT